MSEAQTNARNRPGPRGLRATHAVVDARVRQVYGWLIAGQRTGQIYRLVAEAQRLEREKRAKARAAQRDRAEPVGALEDASPDVLDGTIVPKVWGDGPLPSTRQLDQYIRKARNKLEAEGRELSKSAVMALGYTWARINDLYSRALTDKRYTVCARLIETTARIFGLEGAIKVQFVVPGSDVPDPSQLPEASMSEAQIEAEWQALARTALQRMRATAKSGTALVDTEQALIGAPIKTLPPPVPGNGKRANGDHGD